MRTKHNSKRIRILRRRRLALALITAMAAPVAMAQDLPDSGSVTSGTASIGPQMGTQMTITQTTKGAIIDWGSFNIGAAYGVTFDQQFGASSVILNRVIGYGYGYGSSGASVINGTLSSNGNVFIINPSGITFGSGAQVNVGGLVASTLDIADADFLSGVSSGQYRFTASGSLAGAIWNNGQLTAADGGTIGLIGSQINNAGTISATNGSVVFGATSQVTLDYFGDGLTQVTVSGNGLGVSNCSINCNGGITSSGNVFAQGGHIEMRSNTMDGASAGNGLFVDPANGGRIWISGNVAAPTAGSRRGSVIIDAGMGNIDLGGVDGKTGNVSANANNAGENAGTIELRGNQLFTHLCYGTGPTDLCNANNRLGLVNASAFGAGGSAGEIHIDVNHFYHGGVLQAVANDGSGGLIDIKANDAEIYNRVWAYGNKGVGGTINFVGNNLLLFRGQQAWLGGPGTAYWSASLLAYGTTTGGAVNIDTGSLVVTDLGNVTPEFDDVIPVINVTGQLGGNGGTININANNASIGDTWLANASGDGQGGNISITADSIDLAGGLVASGASGGTVTTTTTGSLFAGASAYVTAGTWLLHAPSIRITPTSGAVSGSGAVLTDDSLSATLDAGTMVQLFADSALTVDTTGNIHIDQGVNIQHATSSVVALDMRATGSIYGSYFNIDSIGGPLDLSFIANANGSNPYNGYVSFFQITLDSNGGDIAMSGDGRGVYLEYSQVSSGVGDITIMGNGNNNGVLLQQTSLTSTGGDISIDASSVYGAAVRLDNADIASSGGNIAINGDGSDGVSVVYSSLASAGGNIAIHGQGIYSGSYFHDSIVDSAEGNIDISGSASQDLTGYYPFGVALAGTTLTSTTGDISVIGDAVGGSGIEFWTSGSLAPGITTTSGAIALTSTSKNGLVLEGLGIATNTGDITIVGISSDVNATAGVFVGSSGLHTNGGDISITGTTAGGSGVFLYYGDLTSNGGDITVLGEGFYYGVHIQGGLISSAAGDISITGTAVGSGSITSGVDVLDGLFASTSGAIAINGSAALGRGVSFRSSGYGPGSSVTTTSGAISVISTGLFGLDVADVPFSTDTGDIRLEGHATGSAAGIFIGSGGLTTQGGNISLIGTSALNNVGVHVSGGDLISNGGDILIYGSGVTDRGVWIELGDVDSGGGAIAISGVSASNYGTSLLNANILSAGGAVSITGTTGLDRAVAIVNSGIDSGGGDITLTGDAGNSLGILIANSQIQSHGGDIFASATAANRAFLMFNASNITSDAGDITLFGNSGLEIYGNIATTSGDINLTGTTDSSIYGLVVSGSITSQGGDISLSGDGADAGMRINGGVLLSNGGAITLTGTGVAGLGVSVSNATVDSGNGDVSITGQSQDSHGVWLYNSVVTSGAGNIMLKGDASGSGSGVYVSAGGLISNGGDITLIGSSLDSTGVLVYNGNIASSGGDIRISGIGQAGGVLLHAYSATDLDSGGGHLAVTGTAYGLDAVGVYLDGIRLVGGIGDVAIDGSAPMGYSVLFANGAGISTTSGAISLVGEGANFGLDLGDGVLATGSGDVYLYGNALATGATAGVRMTGGGIVTNGGDITVIGNSAGGVGVQLGDSGLFAIGSSGGAIMIDGSGVTAGVMMMGAALDSNGGGIGIQGIGSGAGATGVYIDGMAIHGGAGDVSVTGSAPSGSGVRLANGAGITTTSGAITLIGIGDSAGLSLDGGGLATGSGHIDLRGRGLGAGSDGLLVGGGASIVTASGGIELSGEGGSGSGLSLAAGSTLDAGTGLIVLRAGNDGSSDAIRLQGAIHSGTGVNVRPGGVDANGALTERVDDNILLGVDAAGFALSASELALIDSPQLVIGSSLHAGAIQVLGAVSRDGNLTLQNNGGSGGIDLQASLDVGNGTLALSSGGSITQASAGAITAHSLLVNAGGDVLLGNAQNNVAATTLAGSAGGAFQFQDVDTLAIGNVSAIGFDASSGGLSSLGANGITAGSDVLVRNLTGDMILNSDVSGANLDLVTAGRLQNLGSASLIASGDWRVWANTWVGESRGGLAGSGNLPNLYGCTFLGSCGVTVRGTDNHFIYVQQPTALITFDDFSREYGLPNPVFTFTVTGAILGDSAASVASGSASTSAVTGSDVGNYAITGMLTSAAGYRIQLMPGSLAITPAMLFFTADSVIRYFGTPNPAFSGMVSGFRNGDTVTSVFGAGGVWTSPAGTFTSIGFHPIYGGTSARNYVFSQAPGNATALQIIPMSQPQGIPFEEVHETINTYVYDRNFGGAPVCALSAALENEKIASTGDELSSEWTKVRSRPNLTNCFDTERKNGCSSF